MALTKVSTAGVKDDAITKTKIPANQIEASELADNAVDTNAIADQAVALSKLPHGTSSNDGKFLRANNGADPTFETVTGTTINNNADNRGITGSGTANTLNGQSGFTVNTSNNVLSAGGGFGIQNVSGIISGSGGGQDYISIKDSGNTERVTIKTHGTNIGNVGIGTTSPATALEVKDSADSRITITAGNAISQAGINFSDNSGVDGIVTFDHNTRKLHLGAGTSSFTDGDITINSSGNVGIGTASPSKKLDVSGDFHVSGQILNERGTAAAPTFSFTDDTDTGMFNLGNVDLGFSVGGTERMRIESAGHTRFGPSGAGSDSDWGHSNYGNTEVAIDSPTGYSVLHMRGEGAGTTATRYSMGVGDDKFYMAYDDVDQRHNIVVNGSGIVSIPQGIELGSGTDGTPAGNILDDYEEGNWTPSIHNGGGSISNTYTATYTKIGRLVHIHCYIAYTAGSSTSAFQMGGLPFACLSNNYEVNIVDFGRGGKKGAYCRTNTGNTFMEFLYSSESTGSDRITIKGNMIGNGYIILSNTYITS